MTIEKIEEKFASALNFLYSKLADAGSIDDVVILQAEITQLHTACFKDIFNYLRATSPELPDSEEPALGQTAAESETPGPSPAAHLQT